MQCLSMGNLFLLWPQWLGANRGQNLIWSLQQKVAKDKEVRVRRSAVTIDSVSTHQLGKTQVIKIGSFTRDTSEKLKRVLKTLRRDRPIIIDLRGNAGGDLHAAIDSAMLFLQKG